MDESEEPEMPAFSPPAPAPKKRGPKKKAKRSQVKQVKQRGMYKARQGRGFVCPEDDADLIECMFSDEDQEVKDEFKEFASAVSDTASLSSVEHSDTSCGSSFMSRESNSSVNESDISRPSSAQSSRPSSALSSRPSSAMSRPEEKQAEVMEEQIALPENAEGLVVEEESGVCDPSLELIESGLVLFKSILPVPWIPIADRQGFHLLLVSPLTPKAIQREIFISYNGNAAVFIHCKPVPSFNEIFKPCSSVVGYCENSVSEFCQFGLKLVQQTLRYKTCAGANDMDTRAVWDKIQDTYVDSNPCGESDYNETCRSKSCLMLVELGHGKRCAECSKVMKTIAHRKSFLLSDSANPATNNKNLTLPQAMKKLELQHEDIRKKDKQIAYLRSRIAAFIENEGVNIDEDISETFSKILMDNPNLTELQRMFLAEQWAICSKSDARVHRWHPTMIRFALNIYMNNPSNYERMRDLGVIRLPHSRTLFNYTHSIKAKGGINEELVLLIAKKVESFGEPCKEFHVLLCDGMHVSQNLVFRESDGTLVGFTDLDEVDREVERLEKYISGKEPVPNERILANEVVAFLVKGMASDVKCVVASYATKAITKEMLYRRTWDVIQHLEVAGIKILALVADGHPVNRAFFKMHAAAHGPTKFGCIYATFNFFAPDERLLFFISDICHLLKTLRNALYNSGEGEKKPRLLLLNGEKIIWKFIIRLYFTFKNNTFRKSFKLNAQNVFPNSYSKMKVKPAATVLSDTVAQDLEDQHWPESAETVRFLRYCNKFFDCLNGAHTTQGKRKRNPNLEPYTSATVKEDERFVWLDSFVDYLYDWKKQVDALPILAEKKERLVLPLQTMVGIEMSVKAIQHATTYFLDPDKGKGTFLNARIYSQDPLEQHFGAQRCGRGGSRNPNVKQFQEKQVATAIHRNLGCRKRQANSSEAEVGLQLSEEPVPKLKRTRKK